MVTTPDVVSYGFVAEQTNPYLALFPHRYDFIWAERSAPGQRPDWQTESRYPLSDRQILQGQHLYGVRFGARTKYLMIDVDASSPYHPKCDRFAIAHLVEALEPIGLVGFLPCTSSYSGGLHLYFPFEISHKSWDLAFAVQTLLQRAGFKIAPGCLELFPNPKLYVGEGTPTLYAAHRLPLQEPGSYLLADDWNPRFTSQQEFVRSWEQVAQRNDLQTEYLESLVSQARRFQQGLSRPASKFLDDLNTEIAQGWTGHGQTNRLLGRIAMRSYIFGHLLNGLSIPLEGSDLVEDIVRTARQLPGYEEWCRHQHEIEERAEEWARCAENSHYFPYGYGGRQQGLHSQAASSDELGITPTWNQQQEEDARTRISRAIAKLLSENQLPATTTLRFKALVKAGIGGGTLYRHRDLWHPKHLQLQLTSKTHFSEGEEPNFTQKSFDFSTSSKTGSQSKNDYDPVLKSLLEANDRNSSYTRLSNDFDRPLIEVGDNSHQPTLPDSWLPDSWHKNDSSNEQRLEQSLHPSALKQQQHERWQAEQYERMQRYLASGDSILMAEAQAWFAQFEMPERALDGHPIAVQEAVASELANTPGGAKPSITQREQFQVVVEAIAYHLARLRWTELILRQNLLACTGKPIQALLTDEELVRWLQFLESVQT